MPASKQPAASLVKVEAGETNIWIAAAALTLVLLMMVTLLSVVVVEGFSAFWPRPLIAFTFTDHSVALGELNATDSKTKEKGESVQVKVGNREIYGLDFQWYNRTDIRSTDYPVDAFTIERLENGSFYGFLKELHHGD